MAVAPPSKQPLALMMVGLPGAMGLEIGRACLRSGIELVPISLAGRVSRECEVVEGSRSVTVKLVGPEQPGEQLATLRAAKEQYGASLVIVDFTNPSIINSNARLYHEAGINFVMGTTGGDRELLQKETQASGVFAVIAANMGKQIVALQATLERMARDFPGSFAGYSLQVTESHQKTKADTSGTARDMVKSFSSLTGAAFEEGDIKLIRDEPAQMEFGVPEEHLNGHAFHTYSLTSPDGSVTFEFKHNVCGRRTYAEGVVDAALFLASKSAEGGEKRVFSMIDVLEAGAMR